MKGNIPLAVAAFAVRLLLTAVLCVYIRYRARGFARLSAAEVKNSAKTAPVPFSPVSF